MTGEEGRVGVVGGDEGWRVGSKGRGVRGERWRVGYAD